MKGNNSFEWNHATMVEAVQHYLDTILLKEAGTQVVTLVKSKADGHGAYFAIEVKAADNGTEPA